jgi:endonuclease/exonuclease/phosphatase (EEP) superfamily protein YafD
LKLVICIFIEALYCPPKFEILKQAAGLQNRFTMKFLLALVSSISILVHFEPARAQSQADFLGQMPKSLTVAFGAQRPMKEISSTTLRLLVWNVQKGENQLMPSSFISLSKDADLTLFQESVNDPYFTQRVADSNSTLGWTMATSWEMFEDHYTGVATGSMVRPILENVLLSTVTEPISNTPKTILISEFALEGRSETLLVANIHGINFVTNPSYKIQIMQLFESVKSHVGPMIVAGDFNTWNSERLWMVQDILAPLGMNLVNTPDTGDLFSLDHIFVRGLAAQKTYNLNYVRTSDHVPLLVDLQFTDSNQITKVGPIEKP